jgi:hypothetical protein
MSVYMIAHFYEFDKFAHTLIRAYPSRFAELSKRLGNVVYSHTSVASVGYLHYTKLWRRK